MKKFLSILKRIFKVIIIAFLILFVIGLIVTKCDCVKKSKTIINTSSIAFAADNIQARELSEEINLNNGASLPFYNNYKGVNNSSGSYNVVLININNLPKTEITIELNNFITYDNNYFFEIFNEDWQSLNRFTSNIDYYTLNQTLIENNNNFYFVLRDANNLQQDLNYNFNLYIYAGGYVQGFAQGFQAGKEEGKAEGAELAQYGIFQNATVDAKFRYAYPDPETTPAEIVINKTGLKPTYISNGINMNAIYKNNEAITNNGSRYLVDGADITINFINPFKYSNDRALLISGPSISSLVDTIYLTDIKNETYKASVQYNSGGLYPAILSDADLLKIDLVKLINIGFGNAEDTFQNVSIVQDNGNYTGGYTSGYNSGLSDGRLEGEETGYTNGYNKGLFEGEQTGYAKAVAEGVSQEGIFYGAIAFTKTFFQLSTVFLSTPLVGDITLGLLVIGLPCAFMLINLGIGLAKKWLGGRGASEDDD